MGSYVHKIRALMEKSACLRRTVPFFRETRIVRYMLQARSDGAYKRKAVQKACATREEFRACYEAHREEFARLEGMLADDFSRKTLLTVIA